MEIFLGALFVVMFIVAIWVGGWLISLVFRGGSAPNQPSATSEMDEADYHNGPGGYSPMTAYPNSYYGSSFRDEDDEYEH